MDPFLIPVQLLVISIYISRISIVNRFPKPLKDFLSQIANDMKLNLGKPWKTVLVPILVIFITYLGWIFYHNTVFHTFPTFSITDPFFLHILNSGILAPISEEILQCFFLSTMLILFIHIYKNKWMIAIMCFASLTIVP